MHKNLVLITGTQRCGTSLMSNYCKKLGFDMGTDFWHDEINGGLESPDICKFYQQQLNDPIFPFKDFDKSVDRKSFVHLKDLNYDVQKFSFLMMNPFFVDLWVKHRGNKDKLIILCREAEKVCESKYSTIDREKRFSGDSSLLHQTPIELKLNWYDSLMKIMEYNISFTMLKFPNFLDDYNQVYNTLHNFGGLDIEYNPELWYKSIDKNKITVK